MTTDSPASAASTTIGGQVHPWDGPGITAFYPFSSLTFNQVVSVDKVWTLLDYKGNHELDAGMVAADAFFSTAPVIACP